MTEASRCTDVLLFEALRDYIKNCSNTALDKFRDNLSHWGDQHIPVQPTTLPITEKLPAMANLTNVETMPLVSLFADHRHQLRWEQSYRKSDAVVGDDMLAGYGFAEIVGKRGPFLSNKIRAGIGVWGPNIVYPSHHHVAEEIYIVMAGEGVFNVGEVLEKRAGPGTIIEVASDVVHGFSTEAEPVVVLYLWQGGDLRQMSAFT